MKVLSYNIHKGFSASNLNFVLKRIKKSIDLVHADLVFLQEVLGHHERHGKTIEDWPKMSQFEFLADKLWPHFAYGKNAVYAEGHHGNAILSKYPIKFWENIDISTNRLERRGLLHAVVGMGKGRSDVDVICVHLGLFEEGRRLQLQMLSERIEKVTKKAAPLILAGDFNDWQENASGVLHSKLGLDEAFLRTRGRHARTFPIWMPTLKLDRIYYRGFKAARAEVFSGGIWSALSDHAALYCELVAS